MGIDTWLKINSDRGPDTKKAVVIHEGARKLKRHLEKNMMNCWAMERLYGGGMATINLTFFNRLTCVFNLLFDASTAEDPEVFNVTYAE